MNFDHATLQEYSAEHIVIQNRLVTDILNNDFDSEIVNGLLYTL